MNPRENNNKPGFKFNRGNFKSNKRDPNISDIPEIRYHPEIGRSNIFEVQEVLNAYVRLNLPDLHDCIITRKLKYIEKPPLPQPNYPSFSTSIRPNPIIDIESNIKDQKQSSEEEQEEEEEEEDQEEEEESVNTEQYDDSHLINNTYDPDADDKEDDVNNKTYPEAEDDLTNSNIPYEVRMHLYGIRYEDYIASKKIQDVQLSKLHQIIMDLIPNDSQSQIKTNSNYKKSIKTRDGFLLWTTIFEIFQFKENGLTSTEQRTIAARNFTNFKQNQNMDLYNYYKIFKQCLKTMKQVGCHMPAIDEVVQYFVDGLDNNRFRDFKISHLPTEQMIADVLTKPLQGEKFSNLRDKIINN